MSKNRTIRLLLLASCIIVLICVVSFTCPEPSHAKAQSWQVPNQTEYSPVKIGKYYFRKVGKTEKTGDERERMIWQYSKKKKGGWKALHKPTLSWEGDWRWMNVGLVTNGKKALLFTCAYPDNKITVESLTIGKTEPTFVRTIKLGKKYDDPEMVYPSHTYGRTILINMGDDLLIYNSKTNKYKIKKDICLYDARANKRSATRGKFFICDRKGKLYIYKGYKEKLKKIKFLTNMYHGDNVIVYKNKVFYTRAKGNKVKLYSCKITGKKTKFLCKIKTKGRLIIGKVDSKKMTLHGTTHYYYYYYKTGKVKDMGTM